MKHLSIILLVVCFAVLTGCRSTYKSLQLQKEKEMITKGFPSIFAHNQNAVAFDTEILFRSTQVSGLLFFQPLDGGRFRTALTTKMGQKIFDFTIGNDEFQLNYIIPQLKKKVILNLLRKDMQLITQSFPDNTHVEVFTQPEPAQTVYRLEKDKHCVYYRFDKTTGQLTGIESGSRRHYKIKAALQDFYGEIPHQITLDHKLLFKLQLNMHWVALDN